MSSRQVSYLFLLVVMVGLQNLATAQDSLLTHADMRKMTSVIQKCELDSSQTIDLQSVFNKSAVQLTDIKKEQNEIQKADISEDEVNVQMAVLNQKRKDILEFRDFEILEILTPAQREIFKTQIQPEKPQVLHFGIHNRADCKVCTY